MRTLVVRPECTKKPSSISPEASSPLLLVHPPAPTFEPPDPSRYPPDLLDSSLPPEEASTCSEPSERHLPPLYRNASRRAMHAHRFRLVACQYELILVIALNRNCLEIGHASVAQGGVLPAQVVFPTLLTKAQAMEAAGIILMQNRPGPVDDETPIDPHVTLDIAVFCELAGIPLIEHIYIYRDGWPLFVRERGVIKEVPKLLATLREGKDTIAKKELGRGSCSPESEERKRASKPVAVEDQRSPPVEILSRRRR